MAARCGYAECQELAPLSPTMDLFGTSWLLPSKTSHVYHGSCKVYKADDKSFDTKYPNADANLSTIPECHPQRTSTMPPTISTRPQTSRQARRAYLKSRGTLRLSERELRQLERSAELQARADRIKERENKRKANLKKRNERIEKEREARQRMGIASPVKETVGASQLRLDAFKGIGMGLKRKREETPVLTPSSSEKSNGSGTQESEQRTTPVRSPLQECSPNQAMKPPTKQWQQRADSLKESTFVSCEQSTTTTSDRQRMKPPVSCPKSGTHPHSKPATSQPGMRPLPKVAASETQHSAIHPSASRPMGPPPQPLLVIQEEIQNPLKANHKPQPPKLRETSMRPPPSPAMPPPAQPTASTRPKTPKTPGIIPRPQGTISHTSPAPPPATKSIPPSPRPTLPNPWQPSAARPGFDHTPKNTISDFPIPPDDIWAAFLVSNTQIERELSTSEPLSPQRTTSLPPPYQKHSSTSMKTPLPPAIKPLRDDTAALLAGLCTQDLDYDIDPLAADDAAVEAGGQSFGNDNTISDAELEDAVRDLEGRSSPDVCGGKEHNCYDDFFDISTQELCELLG